MKTVQIKIAHAETYYGPDSVIESPEGKMKLTSGNVIVTDQNGGKWVWTRRQCQDFMSKPENN